MSGGECGGGVPAALADSAEAEEGGRAVGQRQQPRRVTAASIVGVSRRGLLKEFKGF